MQRPDVLQVVNQEVSQLRSYQKLLRTTIAAVGMNEAGEQFTVISKGGNMFQCSPLQLVEIEETMVNELLRITFETLSLEDGHLTVKLQDFLGS